MTKKPKTGAHTISQKEKFSLANKIMLDQSLSPATRLVGWYITDHINTRRGYAWPPQETIAKDLGITARTVRRAIKDLAPYFAIDRSHRQHEYRVATPDKLSAIATPARSVTADVTRNATPDIFSTTPDNLSYHPSNHPINSALATARAASTDVDDTHKRLAIFERKLKNKAATDEEIEDCRNFCRKICKNPHASKAAFNQAYRLLENLPEKSQPKEEERR